MSTRRAVHTVEQRNVHNKARAGLSRESRNVSEAPLPLPKMIIRLNVLWINSMLYYTV